MLIQSEIAPRVIGRSAAAVFLLVLSNYIFSAPRGVMLDDDGYFILAAWFNGVAHPPGYPLYSMAAGLFTQLPFGSPAFRVHLCSAVFGALACVVLWCITARFTGSRSAAWVAALGYGFSGTFWSQATVAEVYSLNAFLFFLLLWFCTNPIVAESSLRQRQRDATWIAGIFGLSLANHWPLMLLSAPALLVAAWPRRHILVGRLFLPLVMFSLGLLPYAWMVYRSQVSEIAFFGPIENWNDFWYYLSRQPYREIDHSASTGLAENLRYAGFALTDAARQFGWLGTVLGLTGLVAQWRAWPRSYCWALVLAFSGNTFVLAALLGFDWDVLHRHTFQQYPLIAHGILAIWIALGARTLIARIYGAMPAMRSIRVLPSALAVLLVGSVWLQNAPANFRAHDQWATEFADTLLKSLAPGAVLFTFGDYATGSLAYQNMIEGVRPDIRIISVNGQLFSNRLVSPRVDKPGLTAAAVNEYIQQHGGPVYYNSVLPHKFGVISHGLFFEVGRDLAPGVGRAVLEPNIESYFARMFARGEPHDVGQLIHYRQLTAVYCRTLAGLLLNSPDRLLNEMIERRCGGFYGLLERAAVLLDADNKYDFRVINLLRKAEMEKNQAVSVAGLAMLDNLFGIAYRQAGRHGQALEFFQRSWSRWPDRTNPASELIDMNRKQ